MNIPKIMEIQIYEQEKDLSIGGKMFTILDKYLVQIRTKIVLWDTQFI